MFLVHVNRKNQERDENGEEITEMDGNKENEEDPQKKMLAIRSTYEQEYLSPSHVKEHLRKVWALESQLLKMCFPVLNIHVLGDGGYPTDVFFLETVPVPPTRFRPVRPS